MCNQVLFNISTDCSFSGMLCHLMYCDGFYKVVLAVCNAKKTAVCKSSLTMNLFFTFYILILWYVKVKEEKKNRSTDNG